jgi:tRNA (guanosine-2'-O-)-methyltransferase
LSSDAVPLHAVDLTGRLALVFGNEHSGVSDEIRSLADGNFLIPQVGIIQSLNISVACAVTVYEAFRQKELAGHYQRSDLNHPVKQQVKQDWGLS